MKRIILVIASTLLLIFSAVEIDFAHLTFPIWARGLNPFVVAFFIFLMALLIGVLYGCIKSIKN